jgi:hypothetical protein
MKRQLAEMRERAMVWERGSRSTKKNFLVQVNVMLTTIVGHSKENEDKRKE